MSPAAITMIPMLSNNPTQQTSATASNSAPKFGEVLEGTISNGLLSTQSDSGPVILTTEQMNTLENVLSFLHMNSLTDLEKGPLAGEQIVIDENNGESDALLQALAKLNGECESTLVEFLTNVSNLNFSATEGNQQDLQEKKAVELPPFPTRIPFALKTAQSELKLGESKPDSVKVEAPQPKEVVNQILTDLLTKVTTAQSELKLGEGKPESAKVEALQPKEVVNQILTDLLTKVTTVQSELKLGEGKPEYSEGRRHHKEKKKTVDQLLTDLLTRVTTAQTELKLGEGKPETMKAEAPQPKEVVNQILTDPLTKVTTAQSELKLGEDKPKTVKVEIPQTKETVNQLLTDLLTRVTTAQSELKLGEGKPEAVKVEAPQPKEVVNQILTDLLTKVTTVQSELKLSEGETEPAKVKESVTKEELNRLLSDVPSVIYPILRGLNSLNVEDLEKIDLNGTANILKLAKLQDLLLSQKDMTESEVQMQTEIKNLLESISGKLEKWLSSQPTKSVNELAFVVLENGTNKSLNVVKQVYARMFNFESVTTDETVSNGLTLKTAEYNTQSSLLPFQMTKLEQYVLTASKNGQAVDSEQFVKSFENILSKANFSNANGVQKLLLRLNPENLGSLRIELIQKDGAMVAKIIATTAQAKELLDRQVQGLKEAFTNQNIQVEKVEISQQISTFNAERFAPRDQGQHEQQQQQTEQEIIKDEEETDFTNRFEEALLNLKV